jgi:hypothetical protein
LEICSLRRKDLVVARSEPYRANDVCERWKRDGLTVERQLGTLQNLMALRGRSDYEDQAARISILARSFAPKPDTLKQTDDGRNAKLSQTGRAIR